MAVIIQFPAHVRMFAERVEPENPAGAVVLPFGRVRKPRLRDRVSEVAAPGAQSGAYGAIVAAMVASPPKRND
jgi:hypothetical protein